MIADTPVGQVQLDPTGQLAQDIHCIHCGYNLRSLLPDQACPECGKPVAPSLRDDRLRSSDPQWVRRLSVGMICVLLGGIFLLIDIFGLHDVRSRLMRSLGASQAVVSAVLAMLTLGVTVAGVWLATSPEPGFAGTSASATWRWAARLLTAGFLLVVLAFTLSKPPPSAPMPVAMLAWMRLIIAVLGPGGFATFLIYIAPLGRRASAPHLGRLALGAGIGIVLLGLATTGVSIWHCLRVQNWLGGPPNRLDEKLMNIAGLSSFLLPEALILLAAAAFIWLIRQEARRSELGPPGATGHRPEQIP